MMTKFKISIILIVGLVNFSFKQNHLALCYISQGIFAMTDGRYDGAVSDNSIYGSLLCGIKTIESGQMYYSLPSVKECRNYCLLNDTCSSFVIDRVNRLCYASSFNRCDSVNYMTFLRQYPAYITYDIVPGDGNDTKTTCFQKCLISYSGDCNQCGRRWCSGSLCDDCKKTCWELPTPISTSTYFWPDLTNNVWTICHIQWQSVYSYSVDYSYPYMKQQPLWLQVVVTLSNGSTYNSYFDSVTLAGSSITVGNYLGGPAGNPWHAPTTLSLIIFPNTTTCNPSYYQASFACNISTTLIKTISNQVKMQAGAASIVLIRGYVWSLCGKPTLNGNNYVANVDLQVTLKNNSLANQNIFPSLASC